MTRILVAEDERHTVEQLTVLLAAEFKGVQIDAATTISTALDHVTRTYEKGQAYDVAVLDFKLPRDLGDNPEVDEEVCNTVSSQMPDALIVHITGYGDAEQVREHLTRHKPRQGYPVLISKLDTKWAEELLQVVRKFVHSMRIDAKMDGLFRRPRGGGGAGHQRRRVGSDVRCLTPELDEVMRDIVDHWKDLDEPLRIRIEHVFEISESSTPVQIALRGLSAASWAK